MKDAAIRVAIEASERGWVPDALLRKGIDALCTVRKRQIERNDRELQEEELARFVEELRGSPIALLTEKANEQHYELPADFFKLTLGPRLKYSSCFWDETTRTLGDAERRALELTVQHADLHDGQSILELGCGWGSLSLWMAEKLPNAQITSVSNSASQKAWIDARAAERDLKNLTVRTADMNDFSTDQHFDRVVSVEMFEHMRNYEMLFERISRWLKPSGKLFVHIFCHRHTPYPFQSEGADNWMGRYFFSGGLMPSENLFGQFEKHLRVQNKWVWSGTHYQKTANAWLEHADAHHTEVLEVLRGTYRNDAARWFQRWRMFFMACAQLFGFDEGREWYVCHYRLGHV